MEQGDARRALRIGVIVGILLVVDDLIEYVIGRTMRTGALIPLIIVDAPAAWAIVRYYMHIGQVRRRGEA
jgi:hypothetical protein